MNSIVNFEKIKPVIFTLGYEQSNIEDFIATLQAAGVETLVDVRRFPISRKKGFSKSAFSSALSEANINYIHLVDLGCPNEIRDAYKIDGNWQSYTKKFLNYLATQQVYISELADLSYHASICLTCFERDHNYCHRSMVANAIIEHSKGEVKHLGVKKGLSVTVSV